MDEGKQIERMQKVNRQIDPSSTNDLLKLILQKLSFIISFQTKKETYKSYNLKDEMSKRPRKFKKKREQKSDFKVFKYKKNYNYFLLN